eukprot:14176716-Heterocapsa_arctica.AAC.1
MHQDAQLGAHQTDATVVKAVELHLDLTENGAESAEDCFSRVQSSSSLEVVDVRGEQQCDDALAVLVASPLVEVLVALQADSAGLA